MRTNNEGDWTIFRRYSQFEQLQRDLIATHGKLPVLVDTFPGKKLFNTASAMEERRRSLEVWLNGIMADDACWADSAMELFAEKPPPKVREIDFVLDDPVAAAPAGPAAPAAVAAGAAGTAVPLTVPQAIPQATTASPGTSPKRSSVYADSAAASSAVPPASAVASASAFTSAPATTTRRNAETERLEREQAAAAQERERQARARDGSFDLPPVQYSGFVPKGGLKDVPRTLRQPPRVDQARTVLERAHALLFERQGAAKLAKLPWKGVLVKHAELLTAMRANPHRSYATTIMEVLGYYQHFAFLTELEDERIGNNQAALLVRLAYDSDSSQAQRHDLLAVAQAQLLAAYNVRHAQGRDDENSIIVANVGIVCYLLATSGVAEAAPASDAIDRLYEAAKWLKQTTDALRRAAAPVTEEVLMFYYMAAHCLVVRGQAQAGDVRLEIANELTDTLLMLVQHVPPLTAFLHLWLMFLRLLTAVLDVRDWAGFKSSLARLNEMHRQVADYVQDRMATQLDPALLELLASLYEVQAGNKQFDGGHLQKRFAMWASELRVVAERLRASRFCLYMGFLYKQGAKRKNWLRRLFVFTATDLQYLDPDVEGPASIKGVIPLAEIERVEPLDGPEAEQVEEATFSLPHTVFLVHTPARAYRCIARTELERAHWIDALQRALLARADPGAAPVVAAAPRERETVLHALVTHIE